MSPIYSKIVLLLSFMLIGISFVSAAQEQETPLATITHKIQQKGVDAILHREDPRFDGSPANEGSVLEGDRFPELPLELENYLRVHEESTNALFLENRRKARAARLAKEKAAQEQARTNVGGLRGSRQEASEGNKDKKHN